MKYSRYILFILAICMSCSKNKTPKETQAIELSCQRLCNLSKNASKDTLILKEALFSAYTLADLVPSKQHDSLIAVVSQLIANQLLTAKKYQEVRFFSNNGLRFGLRQTTDELTIAKFYRLIGRAYFAEDNFKVALMYYDSVFLTKQDTATWILRTENLVSIAECYHSLKNIKASESFYKELITLVNNYFSPKQKVAFYNNYCFFLREIKKYRQAINAGYESIKISEDALNNKNIHDIDTNLLANAYYLVAYTYKDSTAYKLSEQYYLKALRIYKLMNNMENYRRCLLNMGLMYRYDKRFDKAQQVLTEGIVSLDKDVKTDFNILRKGKLFNNRSEVYLDIKDYKKALADQDSAIYYLTLYDKRASLTTLLMSNRKSLLSTYENKAKIYALYEENGSDTEGSLKALKYTRDIIKIADDIRADYFSDEAKLTLANDIKPALEKAISVCQKLYQKTKDKQYLEQAFGFVEYSRSMVLYENARLDNQLPPDLKAENEELKKREAALIAKNNVEDLQNYLRLKRQFREKIKALNRNQLATVAELKTALIKDDKTALIEFFVGDSSVFVFTLIQNDLKLIELKKQKDFDKQIENLRQEITQAAPVRDAQVFEKQAKNIYNALLTNTIAQLPTTINQLIMAPDGVLNYLPFEILIKGDPSVYLAKNAVKNDGVTSSHPVIESKSSSFQKSDFLIKNYQISYAYSANLLLEQKRIKKESAPKLFAGFAAKYDNKDTSFAIADVSRAVLTREGAYELKGANEEVKSISDLVGGKAYLNEFATEGSFKKEANQYKILHFAMHSLTDDKDPSLSKLLFTLTPKDTTNDNDLTAAELYATSLKADLAVLSACNTGFGTLNKGEGVMSLARAFTYAGVPSTVTSLWKVPDLTTREIMVNFYKNLKSGMTKDAALREAKLTYLKEAPESIAANPYFWAGFVPMGNMEAMDFSERGPLSISGILAVFLGILGIGIWFWFWHKRRKALA
jgi:CHAT domain-containing protein/tetratricopeptide (TPR) repeat protein